MLKKIRVALAVVFWLGITLLFLDFTGALHGWLGWMAKLQFLPAVLAVNIAVIIFLLVIGGVFNALNECGLMSYMLKKLVHRFGAVRYKLMAVLILFFMAMGSLVGSFEEVVPLVPIVTSLALGLGWDAATGVAMSLLAAEICRRNGIPDVTIDSPHDSELHRHAAVNVVSKECTGEHYQGMAPEAVMEQMMQTAEGLTILTRGGGEMLYGRKGGPLKRMKPFDVEVKSTLGAGDTFKAGCVYGLLRGMDDDGLVRFASACSAIAISRFPLPEHPPKLEEVQELIGRQGRTSV